MDSHHYISIPDLLPHLPVGDGLVGLDLEADSLYRYAERICLVQVCYGGEVQMLDPLSEEPMGAFVDWLSKAKIWMHGADYDMSLMLGEWGIVPPMIYDTQIGAQLLGVTRFGYASLVEQYFGVELSKSSQKADWGARPLSDKMLEYAKNDVKYLLSLAAKIECQLKEVGRYEWFLESCQTAQMKVLARKSGAKERWRISGSGKLNSSGMRYLKAIWEWRDAEAAEWNRPSYMVASNKQLLAWASDLDEGGKIEVTPKMRRDRKTRLMKAVSCARNSPASEWPKKSKKIKRQFDADFEVKLKELMARKAEIANELGIESSVIASRSSLELVVSGAKEPNEVLMNWQCKLLGFA